MNQELEIARLEEVLDKEVAPKEASQEAPSQSQEDRITKKRKAKTTKGDKPPKKHKNPSGGAKEFADSDAESGEHLEVPSCFKPFLQEFNRTQGINSAQTKRIRSLQDKTKELEKEKMNMKECIEQSDKKYTDLEDSLQSLREELGRVQKDREVSDKKCTDLEESLKSSRDAIEQLQKDREVSDKKCADLEETLQSSQEELERATWAAHATLNDLQEQLNTSEKARAEEARVAAEQMEAKTAEISILRESLDRLKQKVNESANLLVSALEA